MNDALKKVNACRGLVTHRPTSANMTRWRFRLPAAPTMRSGLVGALMGLVAGCSQATHNEAAPENAVTVASESFGPGQYFAPWMPDDVTIADFGLNAAALPAHGYRLLNTQPSEGRFPTGLAVARVGAEVSPHDEKRYVRLSSMPTREAVYWNHLLDAVSAIREVAPCGTLGVSVDRPRLEELVAGTRQMNYGLILLFEQSGDGQLDARQFGVLRDTASGENLAIIHVACSVDSVCYESCTQQTPTDVRRCRADFGVAREFERQTRLAVAELIALDSSPDTKQESPWKDDRRILPRDLDGRMSVPWWFLYPDRPPIPGPRS